jgi:hypothetical protein
MYAGNGRGSFNECRIPPIPPLHGPLVLDPGVQAVLSEIASLEREQEHLKTTLAELSDEVIAPSLLVQHASIRRNKRCLLAYQ